MPEHCPVCEDIELRYGFATDAFVDALRKEKEALPVPDPRSMRAETARLDALLACTEYEAVKIELLEHREQHQPGLPAI